MYLLDTMKNRSRSLVQNSPFLRLQLNQPQRSPKAYFPPPLKYLGFVSNKDNVTDCFLNSSWYFRSPYFFFRAFDKTVDSKGFWEESTSSAGLLSIYTFQVLSQDFPQTWNLGSPRPRDPRFPLFEAGNSEILKQNRGEIWGWKYPRKVGCQK